MSDVETSKRILLLRRNKSLMHSLLSTRLLENASNAAGLTGYCGGGRRGLGGLSPQILLISFLHCETYWYRIVSYIRIKRLSYHNLDIA